MTESLGPRFARHLERQGVLAPGHRVVVALSGGVDSTVLLHLLRFGAGVPEVELRAAHFDHGMREGSGGDAHWVRGLCRAWQIPLREERARVTPASEEEAREARYAFLLETLRMEEAGWVVTGHQADDQAETVLFRILRGTGLRGLQGIPTRRDPGIYRPLLPFSREEILAYAGAQRLAYREDPSNRSLSVPRNFIRHRLLPQVEESVSSRAREALRRLARLARENEEGWESLLPGLMEGVVEEGEAGLRLVRSAFLAHHPAVRSRILREALRRRGIRLDEAGTRAALEFTRGGASGRGLSLPGGVRLRRAFDALVLEEGDEPRGEGALTLPGPGEGEGKVVLGGESRAVGWGPEAPDGHSLLFQAPMEELAFPLTVRGWRPGDRIRLSYGTKKLKKLLAEARIPGRARTRVPVLSDARGRVLWVAGVATSVRPRVHEGEPSFFLWIGDVLQH